MKVLVSILVLMLALSAKAQLISRFTWTSNPLTNAVTGPNATSVSATAVSQYVGGSIGYAINPALPTANIDLIVPGSPYFDVNSIDITLYFRREESVASFWKRGSLFNFHMNNGYLNVTFTTTQGSTPGNLTINSGNIVAVADDHAFHRYHFQYDNNTGIARVWVDNTVVYTYTGVAGRPLAWTGAGNVIIGEQMDATSRNIPVLANLTVQNVSNAMLPVELVSFTGTGRNNKTFLQWTAAKEENFSHYVVERSADGKNYSAIETVKASGNYSSTQKYSVYDERDLQPANYYRLKMVDNDGNFEYSDVVKVNFSRSAGSSSCYPNPAVSFVNVVMNDGAAGVYDYSVSTLQGNIVKASTTTLNSGLKQVKIDLSSNVPSGVLIIRMHNRQTNRTETFRIVKG